MMNLHSHVKQTGQTFAELNAVSLSLRASRYGRPSALNSTAEHQVWACQNEAVSGSSWSGVGFMGIARGELGYACRALDQLRNG